MPTPEEVEKQLRALSDAITADMAIMPVEKRKVLRDAARVPEAIVWETVHAIGETELIEKAIGMSGDDLRQLIEMSDRWTAAESVLKVILTGIQGAKLARRHQVATIVARVFMLASQLAKDDAYATLRPYVEEVKRLKSYTQRKRKGTAP